MRIDQAGEQAVVLSVSYDKTRDCVFFVRCIRQYIRNHPHPAIISLHPGLDSVLIEHTLDVTFEDWLQDLAQTDLNGYQPASSMDVVVVPICYDFGYDIPTISARKGLSKEEMIRLHASTEYQVWMIGFMPGFPYLGELPAELQMERKENPDPVIPAGSVAIAEEYVGIYPVQSPGGWHVIGRTPWKIIDYSRAVPWTFDYGMKVRFQQISAEEFEEIAKET